MPDKTTPVWGTIGPRGSEPFSDDGYDFEWARCHKPACPYFVCRRLSDVWCYQHAGGLLSLGEIIKTLQMAKETSDVKS